MVVVATAVGALLAVFTKTNRGSAELLVSRQALAIAEAMLNEVLAAPFTICDPQDATFSGACTGPSESVVAGGGPEAGETRLGVLPLLRMFDNVNDFNNFSISTGAGITDRAGLVVPGSGGYSLTVQVAPVVVAPATWNSIPGDQMLVVTVSVRSSLMGGPVVLEGMRSRFAPRTRPP
ncbi:MAG: hypothetical protein JWL63_2843 [Rhodocyclales bacterium]|nr:hypothetical protein [Rhodocyclales bacterium]